MDGNRRGFLIPHKVETTRRVGEVNDTMTTMYIRRINAMIVPFVFKTLQNVADRKALLDCGASQNFIDLKYMENAEDRKVQIREDSSGS